MKNNASVKNNIVDLISKIGEKLLFQEQSFWIILIKIFTMFMELSKKILEILSQQLK